MTLADSARSHQWTRPDWLDEVGRQMRDRPTLAALVLASLGRDGHQRQAAVEHLVGLDQPLTSPLLALRAADWVPQVRDPARAACERRLSERPAEVFTALAPVAFAVGSRQAGAWLADALRGCLRDGPPDVVAAATASADVRTRRIGWREGVAAGRVDTEALVGAALADPDQMIRAECAEAAVRAARETGDHAVPYRLLASRSTVVRAAAVWALGVAGEVAPAEEALDDRSAKVRQAAQVIVRRAGGDPAGRYRSVLADTADPAEPAPEVLAGLGETGTKADAPLIAPWLAHSRPRGRAEAVRALRRLGDAPVHALAPMIADEYPSVARQASVALLPDAGRLDQAWLREQLDSPRRHVRVAAFRLLRARNTLTRLETVLRLIADRASPMRRQAMLDLDNWFARESATTYRLPSPDQAADLRVLIAAASAELGERRVRWLRSVLRL
ncbi:hypothetical protein EV193_10546 [Herbihabitans rhizosphaerae]|uniref:HEAT repeat protein n=1 Tax=Herbihabitans rhizosphaerae TaxID=1872711 RepID=A0A4Q7KP86_9PSEU|nr:hypothetical protein [Herbihabitans rhizosphaerae]RZS37491.1 hypothetical protein EV193_10546 [Herbihabitans rhizosphaerae]